jgi:signal peptidase I
MAETAPSQTRSRRIAEGARTLGLSVLFAFTVRIGVAQAYEVDGPSMEPTLFQGERVLALRCAYGLSIPWFTDALVMWSQPDPGDVVIVQSPVDGADLVKRVIGLPGDVIEVRGTEIIRNGEPLSATEMGPCDPARELDPSPRCRVFSVHIPLEDGARTHTTSLSEEELPRPPLTWVVPPDHVFVVGDHRDRSNDSRAFGPIPMSRVRARVLFVD